jgi:glycine cleavage system regulatory protein
MTPLSSHDPLDDLIAAALHGELTPPERTQFESRLQTDPAARAAYQEAQLMHDLLEKTHQSAQPDPAFEQRMVSGVRRKLQTERHRETAWESLLALWLGLKRFFATRWLVNGLAILAVIAVLAGVALGPITAGIKQSKESAQMRQALATVDKISSVPSSSSAFAFDDQKKQDFRINAMKHRNDSGVVALNNANAYTGGAATTNGSMTKEMPSSAPPTDTTSPTATFNVPMPTPPADSPAAVDELANKEIVTSSGGLFFNHAPRALDENPDKSKLVDANAASAVPTTMQSTLSPEAATQAPSTSAPLAPGTTAPTPDTRKLIRNAQLDLEVKSFQSTMDQITALTKNAGGYVDTSSSQKGDNGKLQGTVVVKVLPQNLDDFLLKLRDLGEVQNQSVSTDDVTKDYYDTQARLDNSRRMEAQLQDLLKHENSRVSDLLAVERELGRVRGQIEEMQGQIKLYDFQVQYATVTMNVSEKNLNQAAAYLLKEQDDFSLFATDVEGTFQKARETADSFKAQVLTANLNHNSGSDVSAELEVMVAPDQIEPFLAQVKALGRVANFTRQTQRVAKDGGDSDQPADQTLTEKDKVQVHLSIRSDDETRKQVALTVVAKAVDDALEQAKAAALAQAGTEILSSSLDKTTQGQSTAQLSVRVPGKGYSALIGAFQALGRTASLSIQRDDNSGPGANGDDAPVIVSLSLTDDDTPLQETELSVVASDVENQAQQIKKAAAAGGVEVKASSFERQPDGTEVAQMTFRLPMSKYPAFVETLKKLGRVESLTVRRDDRPDQTRTDETAPAEISLRLHNQGDIVADNGGLWATLRQTFGEGAAALFGSVRVIGVLIAFLAPWVFTLVLAAWAGRRIYISRKR